MEKNSYNNYLRVKLTSNHQIKARNGFSDPKSTRKCPLFGDLLKNIFFQDGGGGHLEFKPLVKNAGIFSTDTPSHFFIKGLKNSNQSSNHCQDTQVTE